MLFGIFRQALLLVPYFPQSLFPWYLDVPYLIQYILLPASPTSPMLSAVVHSVVHRGCTARNLANYLSDLRVQQNTPLQATVGDGLSFQHRGHFAVALRSL